MKRIPNRTVRRPGHTASESARKAARTTKSLPEPGGAASPPAVPAILAPQVVPAITASLDLPVGPEGLIDSVSAKFERFVMEQIRAGEKVCATAKQQLAECEQQFQKVAHRAAERWAKSAQPHLEQARRALNLRGDLQLQCEVTHTEQDNGQPMVTAEAEFFTEKRPSGYGGFTYADEVELNFTISLAEMAEEGDEPEQAWRALQTSRQTCQQQTDLLIAWRKKLAEIPYVQRQAKAHLTDVLLQQTEPGRQLYQTLQGQFHGNFQQLRPVPEAYRQYLPDASRLDKLPSYGGYGLLVLPMPLVSAEEGLTEQVRAAVGAAGPVWLAGTQEDTETRRRGDTESGAGRKIGGRKRGNRPALG